MICETLRTLLPMDAAMLLHKCDVVLEAPALPLMHSIAHRWSPTL